MTHSSFSGRFSIYIRSLMNHLQWSALFRRFSENGKSIGKIRRKKIKNHQIFLIKLPSISHSDACHERELPMKCLKWPRLGTKKKESEAKMEKNGESSLAWLFSRLITFDEAHSHRSFIKILIDGRCERFVIDFWWWIDGGSFHQCR